MPRYEEPCLQHSQNFLQDVRLVDYLLDRASIQPDDVVYEPGAGTGIITERLLRRCKQVVAVEKDPRLAAYLRRRLQAYPNVAVHAADFLRIALPATRFKAFGSIPYACTAAIVARLTAAQEPPVDTCLVLQREAAERFVGSPRTTLYAAHIYPWFAADIVHCFQRSDFRPVPSVDSVLMRLLRRPRPLVVRADAQFYRDFVSYAFTAARPAVRRTLRA